ncbi:MAG TPA: hypothetical protein VJN01_09700 [Xanthomonadales bacterium]|nr:hypothetical protein [Xanthomonadales bacterium]
MSLFSAAILLGTHAVAEAQDDVVVTLTPVFDQVIEGDETFSVEMHPPGDTGHEYTIGAPANGQITILDFIQLIFRDGFEDL